MKVIALVQVIDGGWVEVIPVETGGKSGQTWDKF